MECDDDRTSRCIVDVMGVVIHKIDDVDECDACMEEYYDEQDARRKGGVSLWASYGGCVDMSICGDCTRKITQALIERLKEGR